MNDRWTESRHNIREGRYQTLFTGGVSRTRLGHVFNNMCAFHGYVSVLLKGITRQRIWARGGKSGG